nr:DUF1538 domain-containing protein [bacterium]
MHASNKFFVAKVKESLLSVLPITAIVLFLSFTIAPIPTSTLLSFIIGAILLIVGMGLFTLGAETAMTPMGERVGAHMTRQKSLLWIILGGLLIGIMVTVSEPDLQVLASQIPSISNMTLIMAVAIGVGIFLVIALLRILFKIKLKYLLIGFYMLVFILSFLVPREFLAVAFDSGGVTTGPMTVPFIMALGVGVASIRNNEKGHGDSFGLVALCSIGPILAVLLLALVFRPAENVFTPIEIPDIQDSAQLWDQFTQAFPTYIRDVCLSLAPIVIFFGLFQVISLHLSGRQLIKIGVGILYTFLGLVLFLTGVNVGFMPAGNYLGQVIASLPYAWIIIPIGMVIGYFIVQAEPAVHVLNKQVEEMTDGAISPRAMGVSLSIGVALSLGLAMIRVLTGISIFYMLIPGYALALILTFFVPSMFTSIAFDSGGVASGPMTATFLLPFAMGASAALGGNIITDAFGIVAMVAMTPLITIQLLGLMYQIKRKRNAARARRAVELDTEIIELGGEG